VSDHNQNLRLFSNTLPNSPLAFLLTNNAFDHPSFVNLALFISICKTASTSAAGLNDSRIDPEGLKRGEINVGYRHNTVCSNTVSDLFRFYVDEAYNLFIDLYSCDKDMYKRLILGRIKLITSTKAKTGNRDRVRKTEKRGNRTVNGALTFLGIDQKSKLIVTSVNWCADIVEHWVGSNKTAKERESYYKKFIYLGQVLHVLYSLGNTVRGTEDGTLEVNNSSTEGCCGLVIYEGLKYGGDSSPVSLGKCDVYFEVLVVLRSVTNML
jgi:hypothetical protein